ncbi:very short patch repair endonuclease [Sphingomicrobium aestuariivivum]|uniref:very short patch repair endonuclease n=1 Tax=Sphingomicrobium aestuariivivum TaxID=1582356 RepID=UPI001FD6A284|nr:very short patch repair endonuclease [Sphingomicrobium aestuariivivum]MCJ8191380.1 very short patch repair endonuclease [Sphingomicrobium aestuariivivum]
MADIVSPQKRSEMMSGIKNRNTKPELIVRSVLHRSGFRFRLNKKILDTRPDIVLPKWNAAIFVHGCFWHGHEACHLYRLPKSNTDFWADKVEANKQRDAKHIAILTAADWRVLTVWECALKGRKQLPRLTLAQRLIASIRRKTEDFDIRGV